MVRTNLKIGFRNILKNKGFVILNTLGLVVALTAVLLISLWVHSELTFNKSLTNYDTIAGVRQHYSQGNEIRTSSGQPWQLAHALRDQYGSHFKHVVTSSRPNSFNITHNNNIVASKGRFVESGFAKMFDLKMKMGSRDVLGDISSILISESMAKNIFGTENPIGQVLNLSPKMKVTVAGIYEDFSMNSNFNELDFIASWELLKTSQNYEERLGWGNSWFLLYVQLHNKDALDNVSTIIKDVTKDNYEYARETGLQDLFLFPMSKWHLYSKFENGVNIGGKIESVTIFSLIGFFILLLACINFMNLSTAQALKRSKEVGVRKTLGSSRIQLIIQFFTESFVVILISFFMALLLAYILLPKFNMITLKEVEVPFTELSFWFICLLIVVVTAILSSVYPAIYLSAFKPVKVLKGLSSNNKTTIGFRKALIVVQFSISSILIICTITIISQINYAKDRPLGFNKDLIVSVPINTMKVINSFETIKSELLTSPYVDQVTASDVKVTSAYTANGGDFDWKDKDPNMQPEFYTIRATEGFGKMIDWEILEGRDFSRDFPSDSLAFLVNETAVKYMGLENPVGEFVRWNKNGTYKIIGVVKDMVTQSPFEPITPSLFILHNGRFLNWVNIKIASNSTTAIESTLAKAEAIFKKHDPKNLFSYTFLDDDYERKFNTEKRVARLVGIFSFIAIFISCLGILGLSTYMAIQRKKEIGVRKVLGASINSIWKLLSKQFIILVAVSLAIALPLGYFISSEYLMEYSYRVNLSVWTLVLVAMITLGVTLLTVSLQAIKAAIANPVDSLRIE
ncbi:ABC transporter permease [uncultured Winogradskyella sp.]|uniref:ABC transporter permease n=1 Tax=uncultured Winogradskyella sp. TaxID=395353 RepID=UPI00262ACED3|nr:ABC transporter permease [uncultured Winogradskyella sp.]